MHEMTNSLQLGHYTLEPALVEIAGALGWLESLAQQHGWSQRTQYGLTLSADEALTNIVSYGFGEGVPVEPILLTCSSMGEEVLLRIEDAGAAFDPTRQTPAQLDALLASLDDAVAGGHGLRLMLHFLSGLDYQRTQERNVLTLRILAQS